MAVLDTNTGQGNSGLWRPPNGRDRDDCQVDCKHRL